MLERLTLRDGVPFEEACEILRVNYAVATDYQHLSRVYAKFPPRRRARAVDLEDVDELVNQKQPISAWRRPRRMS